MKKILIILFSFFLLNLLFLGCDYDCSNVPITNFEIQSLGIETIPYQDTINTEDFYDYDEVSISIFIADVKFITESRKQGYNFSLISEAYACSPPEPSTSQKISNISIIAKNKFQLVEGEKQVKNGEEVNDYFQISSLYTEMQTINNFLSLGEEIYYGSTFKLFFKKRPFQPTTIFLDIIITLDDGKVFRFEDEVLNIQ